MCRKERDVDDLLLFLRPTSMQHFLDSRPSAWGNGLNVKKGFFKRGNKGKRGECDWQEAACLGFRFARLRNKDDNEREKKTLRYSRLIGKWRRRRWPEVNKVLVIFYFILTRNGRDVEWSLYFFLLYMLSARWNLGNPGSERKQRAIYSQ